MRYYTQPVLNDPGGSLTDQQSRQEIPDSSKPPHSRLSGMTSKRLWSSIGIGVLLGIALNYFAVRPLPVTPGLLVQFVVATWLSTTLHEAGHAMAAAFTGFRLLVFAVKPFKFHKIGNSWKLGWLEKTGLGGFVVVVPKKTVRLRERMIVVVAAGPIASLLIGCATIIFVALASTNLPIWLKTQLNMIGVLSIFTAGLTAFPLTSSFGVSDGQRLRMLFRQGVESERYCTMLLIVAASRGGIRPRDWDGELVERLSNPSDGSPDDRAAQALRYNWLIDSRRITEAEEALQQTLARETRSPEYGISRLLGLKQNTSATWQLPVVGWK